jgi:hypothetical protein
MRKKFQKARFATADISLFGEYFLGEAVLDSSWTTQQGDQQTGKSERRT